MAVPFMLGNFSQGLFGGAQSAASLYTAYQGIFAQQDAADEIQKARDEDKRNKNIEDTVQGLRTQLGTPGLNQDADKTATYATTATPASSTDKGPVTPAVTKAAPKVEGASVNPNASSDPYRKDAATGLTQAPYVSPPQTNPIWNPNNPVGTESIPRWGTQAIPVPYGTVGSEPVTLPAPWQPPSPPLYPPAPYNAAGQPGAVGTPSGPAPPMSALRAPSALTNQPVGSTITSPFTSYTPQEPVPGARGPAMAPTPPPFNAAGVQGPPGSPSGPPAPYQPNQPVTAPIPSRQPGPPIIPPAQTTPGTGGGGAVQGGTPQASAEPQSVGGRVLRFIGQSLIPSAEASGAGGMPHPAPASPAPAAPAAPAPAAPAAPAPAAQPATALTPAKIDTPPTTKEPPKSATPPETKPGPVPVKGEPGTVRTESTPPALAPQVDPSYGERLRQANPELAAKVGALVAKIGGADYNGVAAELWMESKFGTDTNNNGTRNIMQVTGQAQADAEKAIGHKLDMNNPDDSLLAGIVYHKILADDYKLGSGTMQNYLAYRGGPATVAAISAKGLEGAIKDDPRIAGYMGRVQQLYGYDKNVNPLDKSYYTGGTLGPNSTHLDVPTLINTAHTQGPDGALNYIAQTGGTGLGMTEHWRNAQSALERYAIWSGHPENIPHAAEWIAQLSQQGTVSNLIAADQAFLRGDMTGAAQSLARSHAFFPDGSYADIGVDKSNKLWVTTYSEATGNQLSQQFQLTHDMIAQQIIALQNPTTYIQVQQKYRAENAKIDLDKAHTKYYGDMPAERLQQAQIAAQVHEDAIEQRRQANENTVQQRREAEADRIGATTRPIDAEITKWYNDNQPPTDESGKTTMTPERFGAMAEVQRALMYPQAAGGAEMAAKSANNMAENLITGKWRMAPATANKDRPNAPPAVGLVDAQGNPHGYLSLETVGRMLAVPGLKEMLMPTPAAAGIGGAPKKQASAIGAGAGSASALQGGYNQNLAGITPMPMPQQQQPSMVG